MVFCDYDDCAVMLYLFIVVYIIKFKRNGPRSCAPLSNHELLGRLALPSGTIHWIDARVDANGDARVGR